MNNEKDIMNYFHTSLRNCGLYTTLSLTLLSISRFYKFKVMKTQTLIFTLMTIITLVIGIVITFNLNNEFNQMKNNIENIKYIDKWVLIPKLVLLLQTCIAIISVIRVYNVMYN
tara:strand:+ start:422 stop:763 length:342 start_codon:yes stop_codon:yes gene_type:complete